MFALLLQVHFEFFLALFFAAFCGIFSHQNWEKGDFFSLEMWLKLSPT